MVDDHPIFRSGLAHLLTGQDDIALVGVVQDGAEVPAAVAADRPDVVLMDLSMPGVDGVEATRRVLAADAGIKVVALTSFADGDRVLAVLEAGAVGYLLMDAEAAELLAGVRAAARGEAPLTAVAAQALIEHRRGQAADARLSLREREVLALVAEGLGNRDIGRRLEIREGTVKTHISNILAALGVADRTQAALWAHHHGLGVL